VAAPRKRIRIARATAKDAARVAPLFCAYLRFYRRRARSGQVERFLRSRLAKRESVIFLAFLEDAGGRRPAGFVQLYPSFSSLSLKRHWILNDLFVTPEARRHGVARALMERARRLALRTGADELSLETARTNRAAQKLYEQLGYQRDTVFLRYFLRV
jgi:GNAT superfamily N-acetyltransferase